MVLLEIKLTTGASLYLGWVERQQVDRWANYYAEYYGRENIVVIITEKGENTGGGE